MAVEGTGVVSYDSPLERSKWMSEGLIEKAPMSFWAPYKGKTFDSIIMQKNDITANKAGKNVIFDFDGYLVSGAVKGKDTAFGKGEQKRKFSESLTIERYRFPVDNGDEFDGVAIGDLSITQHSDSRNKLGNKWVKFSDQSIFDAGQQQATHIIRLSSMDYDDFHKIQRIVKTGFGYSVGGRRMPMKPFMTADGKGIFLFIVDAFIIQKAFGGSDNKTILSQGDMRGNKNRLLTSVMGKIGNLVVVEAETFFGKQKSGASIMTDGYFDYSNIDELQQAGLRNYRDDGSTEFVAEEWSGDEGFYEAIQGAVKLYSRGLILGAGAFQQAFGRQPDYKWKASQDFDIKSESVLEVWTNTKATALDVENVDYDTGIGGISHGIVAVDVQI